MSSHDLPEIIATYRVQLTEPFGFDKLVETLPYLAALGISHIYCSPIFRACRGSTHGYDVVDHTAVSEALGGSAGFDRLCAAAREQGLGILLDIVPNHMAAVRENRLWWDVLQRGESSAYAKFFDIDWKCGVPGGRRVLLPILGDHLCRVLERGELRVSMEGDEPTLRYFDHVLPLALESQEQAAALAAGDPNAPAMAELIDRQHYRPCFWRLAGQALNYRRFFNIDSLVGICAEREEVFEHAHRLVRQWVEEGRLDGLRVDHIDGPRDPLEYLQRLRELAGPRWIVVEKILAADESLAEDWPVDGTTGYDFLAVSNGLFIDGAGEQPLTDFYHEFTGEPVDWPTLMWQKKLKLIRESFGGDVSRLLAPLARAAAARHYDLSLAPLRDALEQFMACLSVYRTYLRPEQGQCRPEEAAAVRQALGEAQRRNPAIAPAAWEFLQGVLLETRGEAEMEFVARLQQLTGAATAKGVEDTAFYCFNRLISLNEVGALPSQFGVSVQEFHRFCGRMQDRWPGTMLASSTHDTKRGEDARTRIGLLSEIPSQWCTAVRKWARRNEQHRRHGMPDRNAEYFFYQSLVGCWPVELPRLDALMLKAAREAKVYTSWTDPQEPYEEALRQFVHEAASDKGFVAELESFLAPLLPAARVSSLAQTLLKLAVPGVPDIYQGCELWQESLVDPDNRRPVDFARRRALLTQLESLTLKEILSRMEDGLPKLFLLRQALRLRREHPAWFSASAAYRPLEVHGEKAQHVVGFLRGRDVAVVVPRLVLTLGNRWGDTNITLPPGPWHDVLTQRVCEGGDLPLAQLLQEFPVALLTREGA